jgi:hypothetical protein
MPQVRAIPAGWHLRRRHRQLLNFPAIKRTLLINIRWSIHHHYRLTLSLALIQRVLQLLNPLVVS